MVGKFGQWVASWGKKCQVQKWIFGQELQGTPDCWNKEMKYVEKKKSGWQIIFDRMEKEMFKWYGNVARMEDNRCSNRKMTWSPGRRRRGPTEIKCEN